ncbi:MAG: FmdB family zinc ribbon protein [Trebonia sp.]
MPVYGYLCDGCGPFQASRPIAEAAVPQPCPDCGHPSARELARPHVRTSGASVRYIAEARNEKSANEPATEHRLKGTTGHHHQHGRQAHAAHGYAHGGQEHRPWMIGH